MPSLIHSIVDNGGYEVLTDSGTVKDSEALFMTRKRKVLFRGSEERLIEKFPVGRNNSPSGGNYMLCSGVQSAELCEGTAVDPHWEAEINWVGIHSSFKTGTDQADFIYRLIYNFARNEQTLPITIPSGASGGEFTIYATPPYIALPITNSAGTGYKRVRLINFVPMIQVVGVIYSPGAFPVSPDTGKIKLLINSLNGSAGAALGNLVQDWSRLPDPLYSYAVGFLGTESQEGKLGKFVPVSMSSHRHLSFGDVHAFTLDLTWEQGLTP